MKHPLTPQQKKTNSYAKDRRNAYGERGANSRFAIRRNKEVLQRRSRRTQDACLREADVAADTDDWVAIENHLRILPVKHPGFAKHADMPLGVVVRRKLARREGARRGPDLSRLRVLRQDFDGDDQARLVGQSRAGMPSCGWQLPPEEVRCQLDGEGGGWRQPDHYNIHLQLWHLPTGLTIAASSLREAYTCTEFHEARNALYLLLYAELERQVVRHLHIPGYSVTGR